MKTIQTYMILWMLTMFRLHLSTVIYMLTLLAAMPVVYVVWIKRHKTNDSMRLGAHLADKPAGVSTREDKPADDSTAEVKRICFLLFDGQGILRCIWIDVKSVFPYDHFTTAALQPAPGYRFIICDGIHSYNTAGPEAFMIGETTFNEACTFVGRWTVDRRWMVDC